MSSQDSADDDEVRHVQSVCAQKAILLFCIPRSIRTLFNESLCNSPLTPKARCFGTGSCECQDEPEREAGTMGFGVGMPHMSKQATAT